MKSLPCWLAALTLAPGPLVHAADSAQVVPTTYEAGHFYAVPETRDGQRLKLLVDTGGGGGGGMYWITKAAAQRLHLATSTCTVGSQHLTVARLPDYKPGHGLPIPLPGPCGKVMLINDEYDVDGQLGAGYLPGRLWTFDYPAQRLSLENPTSRPDPVAHKAALGFPNDDKGRPVGGMARIVVRIDGQPLDMLLDTGATAHPTAEGQRASGLPTVNGYGVTSYILTSVFNRWHQAHPGWRVVEKGDDLFGPKNTARLIEVPQLEIADWSVGPVWFTERGDQGFHALMDPMMDKPPQGAIGGNVFEHFRMTLDYPHRYAYFRCASGCSATPLPAP